MLGRPKGRPNMKTIIERTLTEQIELKTPRGPRRICGRELALLKLREQAGQGNLKAIGMLLQLALTYLPDEGSEETEAPEDRAVLEAYERLVREQARRRKGDEG
jgi:hypothetical protein